MANQLQEFFNKDGSIGLILAIGPDGARFKEIKPQVAVSHDTLSNRIDEARKLGLINTEPTSEVGTTFRNTLSKAGQICYSGMLELGLDEAHAEYVKAIKKYSNLSDTFADKTDDKEEWYHWFGKSDPGVLHSLKRGRSMSDVEASKYPEPLQQALQQDSVEPLLTSEIDGNIDLMLWYFMYYPPKPDPEDVKEADWKMSSLRFE